ncbi:elongation factor P [Erythrobacter sp. HKB08]|uniref:elongation factor P n=1 Tax=Erythrobacter sp. HKB08 TaxID=2502843 RepID=UPI001F30653F|nr:elongation factor P [Erythrobacter sp. HKB08]
MKHARILSAIACMGTAIALTAPLSAVPGRLGTLPHGEYVCSLPGDAGGLAWQELPGKGFVVDNASSYHTDEGSGTYLLAGDTVTFTRGPMKGMRFERISSGTLRVIEKDGEAGRMRCVRRSGARPG